MSVNKNQDSLPDNLIEILVTFVFYLMDSYIRLPDKHLGVALSKYPDILVEHLECSSSSLTNTAQHLADQRLSILEINHQMNSRMNLLCHDELVPGKI